MKKENRNTKITLLNYLSDMGYDVYEDFLDVIDDIKTGYADLEAYKRDPSVFDAEEIEFLKTDIQDWENQIAGIKSDFLKRNKNANWEREIKKVKAYQKEREI